MPYFFARALFRCSILSLTFACRNNVTTIAITSNTTAVHNRASLLQSDSARCAQRAHLAAQFLEQSIIRLLFSQPFRDPDCKIGQ